VLIPHQIDRLFQDTQHKQPQPRLYCKYVCILLHFEVDKCLIDHRLGALVKGRVIIDLLLDLRDVHPSCVLLID
jgi:hypothetical protein